MLLRMIYDDSLAQAAYLIGCQKTGEAIIIDPERDVDRYIDAAKRAGLRVVACAETHIHADFVSGCRELAEKGVKVYVSGEGGSEWQSEWVKKGPGNKPYDHRVLRNGDTFTVGGIEFKTIHTPGHTPEHICFMVTDKGGGATEPMGIATGDFVFVGDLGRPDLLETAAGKVGSSDPGARALFKSVQSFGALPDYLQVWPAHGAGSACGKALGAVPQSTVGYEKRNNPAIRAAASESGFVNYILAGQPEPPMYFARMKRVNREGPRVLGTLPRPKVLPASELKGLDTRRVALVDTRPWAAFKAGHVPGALFAPLDSMFSGVVGSYIADDEPVYLVVEPARIDEVVRLLVRIGIDDVRGVIDPSTLEGFEKAGGTLIPAPEIAVGEAHARIEGEGAFVLDVRRRDEHAEGHVAGALNIAHTRLPERIAEIPRDRRIIVHCRSGARSARACAYLRRAGYDVTNLAGGFLAWEQDALTVES